MVSGTAALVHPETPSSGSWGRTCPGQLALEHPRVLSWFGAKDGAKVLELRPALCCGAPAPHSCALPGFI